MTMTDFQPNAPTETEAVIVESAVTGYFVRTNNEYQDILCRLADGGIYIYNRHQRQEYFVPKALIDAYSD